MYSLLSRGLARSQLFHGCNFVRGKTLPPWQMCIRILKDVRASVGMVAERFRRIFMVGSSTHEMTCCAAITPGDR